MGRTALTADVMPHVAALRTIIEHIQESGCQPSSKLPGLCMQYLDSITAACEARRVSPRSTAARTTADVDQAADAAVPQTSAAPAAASKPRRARKAVAE